MFNWFRNVYHLLAFCSTVGFTVSLVYSLFANRPATIAGLQFDSQGLVHTYLLLTGASLSALVALSFPWLRQKFRTKSSRFAALPKELLDLNRKTELQLNGLTALTFSDGDEAAYLARRELLQRTLTELGIETPEDDDELEDWNEYLSHLGVLAERRLYKEAVAWSREEED